MDNFERGRFKWQMLELSDGITTSNGNWYHITKKGIENYVPGLLRHRSLERLIQEADAWVKSSDGFALLLFFSLAFFGISSWLAAAISLAFYFIWYFNTGFFVNVTSTPVAKLLAKDGVIYGVSAVFLIGISFSKVMSVIGISVEFSAIWYGLALFFLYKVGLLRLMIEFIRKKFFGLPEVSKEDRVLNMLLIRYGMKYGILTGEINEMEKELVRIINYHKQKKK